MKKVFSIPGLGMRNIKTAISVFLCVLILNILLKQNSFYAAIAAVSCLQNTVGDTLKTGIDRTIGTVWGGVIGLLALTVFHGNEPHDISQAVLTGIGISSVIYGCNHIIKRPGSCTISCIVFLGILTNMNGRDPYFWAVNRIFTTILGIVIALTVNSFFPYEKNN